MTSKLKAIQYFDVVHVIKFESKPIQKPHLYLE